MITRTADQLEHLIDHHIRQRHPNPPSNPPRTDLSRSNAACVQLALAISFPPHPIHPHLVPFSPLPLPVQRKWPVRLVTSVRFGPERSQMGSKRNYIITITSNPASNVPDCSNPAASWDMSASPHVRAGTNPWSARPGPGSGMARRRPPLFGGRRVTPPLRQFAFRTVSGGTKR